MKYFTAVVDCNSFTEAAEQCYISQSAISQQIRALEKDLGVELIHRENRRFSLTPAGTSIRRLPIMQNGQQLRRNYCVFWVKEQTNYYIEEFAELLKKLLHEEKQA